jgi:2-polyprenyl-3-methyl-5-hydroxy-6-metoxy-1,4-benzoquinol methylase
MIIQNKLFLFLRSMAEKHALPLIAERIAIHMALREIDFGPVRSRYGHTSRAKYLKPRRNVRRNLRVCRALGLLDSPPLKILDIGCGSGFLLYCAQRYGHEAVGIDVEDSFFAEMAALYGVDRRIAPVRPFEPLTIEGRFDVVTSTLVTFDRYRDEQGRRIGNWGGAA